MASPTSPRRRHGCLTATRTSPAFGSLVGASTSRTLRRISSPATCHFSHGPRHLLTSARTDRIREKIHLRTACPKAFRESVLRPHQDRKSTRLNSSHDQISYAVFCLKKKNIAPY